MKNDPSSPYIIVSGHHRFEELNIILESKRAVLRAAVTKSSLVCAIFDPHATNLEKNRPIVFEVENKYLVDQTVEIEAKARFEINRIEDVIVDIPFREFELVVFDPRQRYTKL